MHFTKSQIEEIRQRLAIQTKKDSEFPDAEIPLDGSERLPVIQFIPAVQDWENRLLSFADMRRMVLADVDMELIGCQLTVTCNTPGATIVIKNSREQVTVQSGSVYSSFYGEVNTVTVSAEGYDTWYESVTMTQDHTLVISLNLSISAELLEAISTLQGDVSDLKGNVHDLEGSVGTLTDRLNGITLVNNGDYYTLTVGETSVDFYSRAQINAIIGGQGSGDATPSDPGEAFLNFSTNEVTIPASGESVTTVSVLSNIPWSITMQEMPNVIHDTSDPTSSTAINVSFDDITLKVGDSIQIEEK